MSKFSSADHPLIEACAFNPARGADRINDYILLSRSTSNAYVVTHDAGDVVINTGTPAEAPRTRDRFEEALGRPLRVAKIIFTQDHYDHIGGWSVFADDGSETIVHRTLPQMLAERALLGGHFLPRAMRILHPFAAAAWAAPPPPTPPTGVLWAPPPEDATVFSEQHSFEVGGRTFELRSTPSGESQACLVVWLPAERVLFTGNWMGALYGALPHFYTLRGDRQRSIPGFLRELEGLIALEPELLITGHGDPIVGAERINKDLTRLHDAVAHLHDETVRGMNEQRDLSTLMREISLPDHLAMAPGRGPESWYVRAVYEEYNGWFRQELTTELYGTSPRAIWPDLARMAGGAALLAAKAQEHLDRGEPLEALHYLEIAVAAEPDDEATRRTEIAALEQLIERTGGRTFDELGWLESKLAEAQAALPASQ